jgi:hypothetical protein
VGLLGFGVRRGEHRYNVLRVAKVQLLSLMAGETEQIDAEQLKLRVRELRRFL